LQETSVKTKISSKFSIRQLLNSFHPNLVTETVLPGAPKLRNEDLSIASWPLVFKPPAQMTQSFPLFPGALGGKRSFVCCRNATSDGRNPNAGLTFPFRRSCFLRSSFSAAGSFNWCRILSVVAVRNLCEGFAGMIRRRYSLRTVSD